MKRWLLVTVFSLLLVFLVYPAAFRLSADTLPDGNDSRLIAYIIGQVQQNVLEKQPLFYGTFFAPDQNTLSYSEPFLTSSLLTLPARLFTDHPIIIANLAYIIGFFLTLIFSYLFFHYLFHDDYLATLCTVLINFSGFHFAYFPHLQVFALWSTLLSLYFFLRYLQERRPLLITLFYFALTLQVMESLFPVYLIFFACVILYLSQYRLTRIKKDFSLFLSRFLPFIPIWSVILRPYLELHHRFPEASRPIRDAAHFSLGLEQIFTFYHSWTLIILFLVLFLNKKIQAGYKNSHGTVNCESALENQFDKKIQAGYKNSRELEICEAALPKGAQGCPPVIRERPACRQAGPSMGTREYVFICAAKVIFLFALIMSLGPVLKILGQTIKIINLPIPLPYTLFYYLFPGFTGFRTPSRFIILALIFAVIIIGYRLVPIFSRLKSKTKIIFIIFIFCLQFIETPLPLSAFPVNINRPPVYDEVKALPDDAVILELPILLWNAPEHEIESVRSLYSLYHRHRRLGGYSGFARNDWINLVNSLNSDGLSPKNLKTLRDYGVTHLIQKETLTPLP